MKAEEAKPLLKLGKAILIDLPLNLLSLESRRRAVVVLSERCWASERKACNVHPYPVKVFSIEE